MYKISKKNKNILIVDDEPKITEVVSALLESRGYCPFCAANGREAFEIFDRQNIALVILDLMLPDMSGEEICRKIRQKSRAPIIMLTAKVAEDDLVTGLNLGADDYITKPFGLNELHARIESVLRRSSDDLTPLSVKNSFNNGDLIVDFEKGDVKKKQKSVALTANELKILSLLVKYPGRIFTRDRLIESALGDDFDGDPRTVDSHIKNLRAKIEDNPKNPVYVLTVHGMGYKFGGEKND